MFLAATNFASYPTLKNERGLLYHNWETESSEEQKKKFNKITLLFLRMYLYCRAENKYLAPKNKQEPWLSSLRSDLTSMCYLH